MGILAHGFSLIPDWSMRGELVSILTGDHVRLDGFFAKSESPSNAPFDGVVISHGLGGNFYGSRLTKALAKFLSGRGIDCLLGNSRGHDILNWTSRSARTTTIGAAKEDVAESVHDVNGWATFLQQQGCTRILLAGHSLGAIKTLYSVAQHRPESVAGVVGLSATRLNYDRLMDGPAGDRFRGMIEKAESRIEAGAGDDLLQVDFPFPVWMTARAYLEKYGPANRFDWFSFIEKIDVPALLLFGELELRDNPAFEGMREQFPGLMERNSQIRLEVIEKADHFYSLNYEGVRVAVGNWLDSF